MPDASQEIEIVEEVGRLFREMEQALIGAGVETDKNVHDWRTHLRTVVTKGRHLLARLRAQIIRRAHQVDRFVRGNLYVAIAIAAAIGSLFGALVARFSHAVR